MEQTLAMFLQIAFKEMNVKEIKGKNHNPRILHYFNHTSLRASNDETPWCAAFVNYVIDRAGSQGTNSARARSFESWGLPLSRPTPGCIAVYNRGDNSDFGHVNFYLYETKKYIYGIGGNQDDSVCITKLPKNRLICYRCCW